VIRCGRVTFHWEEAAMKTMQMVRQGASKSHLLAGAVSSIAILAASGGSALAQTSATTTTTATDKEVETIVVVGIRRGIESAINTKKTLGVIAEVVSAEDIGKLPDVSIAESLARLPGVAAQRIDGRASQLSVRGLGPDYTTTLLNGREQVSVGDNRGVEFDQYPSELLGAAAVYKTPVATLLSQGVAGTVDLQSIRPLKFGRRQIAIGARYEQNDLGALNEGTSGNGNRLSLAYIDQFMDGKLGIALGYAHMESPYQSNRFEAWGDTYPTVGGPGAEGSATNPYILGGAKPYALSGNIERDGLMGVIEFQPSETLTLSVDGYYSKFNDEQILRGIELPLWWGSGSAQQSTAVVTNGLVSAVTYTGVKGVIRNDVRAREAELAALAGKVEWDFTARDSITVDLSWSKADRTDTDIESYAGTGKGNVGATDTLRYVVGEGGRPVFKPTLNYGDYATIGLTDPGGWGQNGYYKAPNITDELQTLKISARHDFGDAHAVTSVDYGIGYSDRTKEKIVNEWFLDLANGASFVSIPTSARVGQTNLEWLGLGNVVSYDPRGFLDTVYTRRSNTAADVAIKSWEVTETVLTAFAKFNIDTQLFGLETTGDFGLQVVSTEQESSARGRSNSTSTLIQITEGDSSTEVLPNLNLAFAFGNDSKIRVAAARTLSRPRMDQMNAAFSYSYDGTSLVPSKGTRWFRDSGNPQLKPIIAQAFDVSYEKYFGRRAYFAAALFYKNLESWIVDKVERPFNATGLTQPPGTLPSPTNIGLSSSPGNVNGGYIRGAEFTASFPFDQFVPALEGFGASLSATYNDSAIKPLPGSKSINIPGLSESVINTSVYYERYGFQARLSNRYRSAFNGQVVAFGASLETRRIQPESVLDGQIGYTFKSGPLNNLSILLQMNNITDEPFVTWNGDDARRVKDYQEYGRTVLFGVNYKF
jgi:iron complex outermembrane recepter protein